MALILLTLIGFLTGWFASIVTRTEERGPILRQIGLGLVASIAGALMANSGTFLGSLSWTAMGIAIAVSLAVLAGYNFYLNRRSA